MPWQETDASSYRGGKKTGRVAAEKIMRMKDSNLTHGYIQAYKTLCVNEIKSIIHKADQPLFLLGFDEGFDGVINLSKNYHSLPLIDIQTTGLGAISESSEPTLDFNFSDNDIYPINGKLEDAVEIEEPKKKKRKTTSSASKKSKLSKGGKKSRRRRHKKK